MITSSDPTIYVTAPDGTKVLLGVALGHGLQLSPSRDFPSGAGRINTMTVTFEGSKGAIQAFMRDCAGISRLGKLRAQAKRKGRGGWKKIA